MSCISTDCPLFRYCKNAIPTLNSSGIPYASYATGDSTGRNDYWCGPNGKYRMFQPIGMPNVHGTTVKHPPEQPAVSLFRGYKGEKRFYLLFEHAVDVKQLSNCSDKFMAGYLSTADSIEYQGKLTLHMENFSYGAINLLSFDFIEPVESEITLLKGFAKDTSMFFPTKSPSAK